MQMLEEEIAKLKGEKVETVRYGNVVTYYPDGKKAAVF